VRMQDTEANCGPASLSNALLALGITRSQAECEVLCGQTGAGVDERKMKRAIEAVGRSPAVISERRPVVALLFLERLLADGRPVLLAVDEDSHWVTAVAKLGPRVLVADPADNELVLSYDVEVLAARWVGPRGRYYGLAV
jgi:ABC-type bacteriocin/lantibiotic exporter with double-glycine peptidase domain